MTAEQRAPLAAFFALLIASVVVLGHAMRTDGMGGLFVAPAQTVIAGARLAPIPQQLLAAGVAAVARGKADEVPVVITDQVVTHIVAVGAARSVGAPSSAGARRPTGRPGSGAVLQQPVQAITATLTTTPGLTAGVLTGTTQLVSTVSDGVVSSVGTPAAASVAAASAATTPAATAPLGAQVASFGSPLAGVGALGASPATAPVSGSAASTSPGWSRSHRSPGLPAETAPAYGAPTHLSGQGRSGWRAPGPSFAAPQTSHPSSNVPRFGQRHSGAKAPVTMPTPPWSRGHGSSRHGSPSSSSSSHGRGYGIGYGQTTPAAAKTPSQPWSAFGQQGGPAWGHSPFSPGKHGR